MKQHQHILVSLGSAPKQGPGSPIIIDRHLKRLPSSWQISIVAPEESFADTNMPDSWQLLSIPMRRWWWPPYRRQIPKLLETRFLCWQMECEKIFLRERPTAIVTVLHDIYSVFAAYLSKIWQVPLSVIVHDQEELWAKSELEYHWIKRNWQAVLNQATRVWTVSSELANTYNIMDTSKVSILLPIPEGRQQKFVEWKDRFKTSPVIAYAGSIYPSQVSSFFKIASLLEKLNGTLLLVTPLNRPGIPDLINNCPNIEHRELFTTNVEVINFLAEKASCILVPYPLDLAEHPWAATCFPSKLVEFSHLGLPAIILAPLDTALGNWAIRHKWDSYLTNMDEEMLLEILYELTEKEKWTKMANQCQRVSQGEFNPELIQSQFESELAVSSKINGLVKQSIN
ncbi:hypothetical protein GNF11_08845 [Nostoc sp. UCD122]|nr:hypothetical protein [Nostoc sp. UCD122]